MFPLCQYGASPPVGVSAASLYVLTDSSVFFIIILSILWEIDMQAIQYSGICRKDGCSVVMWICGLHEGKLTFIGTCEGQPVWMLSV